MTPKHKEILNYLFSVEKADVSEIYRNVTFGYYANENKHLGNILSTMVKLKLIERVQKGVFRINKNAVNYQIGLFKKDEGIKI